MWYGNNGYNAGFWLIISVAAMVLETKILENLLQNYKQESYETSSEASDECDMG